MPRRHRQVYGTATGAPADEEDAEKNVQLGDDKNSGVTPRTSEETPIVDDSRWSLIGKNYGASESSGSVVELTGHVGGIVGSNEPAGRTAGDGKPADNWDRSVDGERVERCVDGYNGTVVDNVDVDADRCKWPVVGDCSRQESGATVQEWERRVKANNAEQNALYNYANNYISTSKYNVFTFLPKNLFEQFQRIANAYFLILMILQLIPWIASLTWITTVIPLAIVLTVTALKDLVDDFLIPVVASLNPLTTAVPLFIVLAFSACKDAHDDMQRHRSDSQVNNRLSWVLRDGRLLQEQWRNVVVGDIIRLESDHFVTADILLLSASEPNSLCYIETAELDGETNLKVRQALVETADMNDDIEQLSRFTGEVVCEPPNNVLSKFEGTLTWNEDTFALDNDKILLRGCVMRNTSWCYGLVLFAGRDTKLMMNSGQTVFKRTHIDRLMNKIIIGIFIFLLVLCLICAICNGFWETTIGNDFQAFLPWESFVPGSALQGAITSDKKGKGAMIISILVFFSYIIVLNTLVPISLYVSFWINWDVKMYFVTKDTPAKARTTTLNEELGQIEYIFSDKTGTLTQNIMTFNKCSINGRSYGDAYDEEGNPTDVTEATPPIDFSSNPVAQKDFKFYDHRLWELVQQGDASVHEFFRLLAVCHTVMPEHKNGELIYQAQSPDEGALVNATRNFGFVFRSRTANSITIEIQGKQEVYELLCILDFNNVRKRMSVIVRRDNKIRLYCKGADSTVCERLHPSCADLVSITTSNLNDFAQIGLRTLCLAVKDIDPDYFKEWKKRHHQASTSLVNRDDQLDVLYEEIEKGMLLIGATAIEDKLQDGVPEAIANLALAGIKIWVLTGDKQETAINIGYSCQLLTEEMEEVFIIDGETADVVQKQLQQALVDMKDISSDDLNDVKTRQETVSGGRVSPFSTDADNNFAIVVNGCSLVHALTKEMELLLLRVASRCRAVICCRVTPLQKALVVELVKRNCKSITLAIGDGANDVSMIKSAHIGVGISGQEGMQAVLASDFSMAQFRYLERLLLVHGRWSYLRMCKFLRYFFYKNFTCTLCHFWYAIFCGFSAQTLFDPYFITLYNVVYTALPVLIMGVFDKTLYDEAFISLYNVCYTSLPVLAMAMFEQDVNDEYSVKFPKLYTPGQRDQFFNKIVFAESIAEGIFSSLILFMFPYAAYQQFVGPSGLDLADQKAFGFTVASILIVVVTLRCALEMSYWTPFNHVVIWGSMAFYFCFINFFYAPFLHYSYVGTSSMLMSTASFWLTMLLTVVVLLLPVVLRRLFQHDTAPTLTDKVRLRQNMHAQPSSRQPRVLRRASTARGSRGVGGLPSGSRRSIRSTGYAFAQQPGYGDLITTGSMMQIRPRPKSTRAKRPPPAPAPAPGVDVANKPVRYVHATQDSSKQPQKAPETYQPRPLRELPQRRPIESPLGPPTAARPGDDSASIASIELEARH